MFVLLFSGELDVERAIELEDFQPGKDIVQVRTPTNLPATGLERCVSADPEGDAVVTVNSRAMVLHGVRASDVSAHPTRQLSSVASLPAYMPLW